MPPANPWKSYRQVATQTAPLWAWYDALRPNLWRKGMKALAACEQVCCKLSCLCLQDGPWDYESNRQIVGGALLTYVRGREVDGDSPRRQREPRGNQGGAHPVLGFGNGLIRQADNGEGGQARRYLRLHIDGHSFNPLKRYSCNPRCHSLLPNSNKKG